jgi:hypothetical protein
MALKMTGRWYRCHASVDGKRRGREHLFRDGSDRAELAASEKADLPVDSLLAEEAMATV